MLLKLTNMEFWVNVSSGRKVQFICCIANLLQDFKWAIEFSSELEVLMQTKSMISVWLQL
jgi:hypothetical protein